MTCNNTEVYKKLTGTDLKHYVLAADEAAMVILDNSNAAKLPAISGRFILHGEAGTEQVFQAYMLNYHQNKRHFAFLINAECFS